MQSLPKHPKQAEIIVYSKDYCPYCTAAKNLFTQKGVGYTEIDVTHNKEQYEIMLEKSAPRKTVPQIFINNQSLGGFDDVKKLDSESLLEAILFPQGR